MKPVTGLGQSSWLAGGLGKGEDALGSLEGGNGVWDILNLRIGLLLKLGILPRRQHVGVVLWPASSILLLYTLHTPQLSQLLLRKRSRPELREPGGTCELSLAAQSQLAGGMMCLGRTTVSDLC